MHIKSRQRFTDNKVLQIFLKWYDDIKITLSGRFGSEFSSFSENSQNHIIVLISDFAWNSSEKCWNGNWQIAVEQSWNAFDSM